MTAGRPYVDRRVVDLDAACAAASTMASVWGLQHPELLRIGMNAIFASGDVVVRVGRASAPAAAAHALVAVLHEHGIPTVEPIDGLVADRGGFAVTAWERVRPTGGPVDWRAVGAAVRLVHRLAPHEIPPDYPLPSPTSFPWWDFDRLMGEVADHLDDASRAGLTRTIERHHIWRSQIGVDTVVCHGDVHPGNVLMTGRGPLLIDWDLLCTAPPGWDHAMLTTYAARWGGDRSVYPAFAAGYGCDLANDPFTASVGELRNVAATLMRVRAGITDEPARLEAERRLRFWRGDDDAPVWTAQ